MWAATTKDKDYIQMVGMKYVVNNLEHRNEFITGNLGNFMTKGMIHSSCELLISSFCRSEEFQDVSQRVGPDNAVDFNELRRVSRSRQRFSFFGLLQDQLRELPQVPFGPSILFLAQEVGVLTSRLLYSYNRSCSHSVPSNTPLRCPSLSHL